MLKNNSGADQYGLQPGVVGMNPGVAASAVSNVAVTWTCLVAGDYQIASAFTFLNALGAGAGVKVYKNLGISPVGFGGTELASGVIDITPGNTTLAYNATLTFGAGETITWLENSNGNSPDYEITALNAVVTTVPEPSSLALLALGGAGVVWMRSRRRKN